MLMYFCVVLYFSLEWFSFYGKCQSNFIFFWRNEKHDQFYAALHRSNQKSASKRARLICLFVFCVFRFLLAFTSLKSLLQSVPIKCTEITWKSVCERERIIKTERKGKLDLNNDYGEGAAGPSKCDFLANRH